MCFTNIAQHWIIAKHEPLDQAFSLDLGEMLATTSWLLLF